METLEENLGKLYLTTNHNGRSVSPYSSTSTSTSKVAALVSKLQDHCTETTIMSQAALPQNMKEGESNSKLRSRGEFNGFKVRGPDVPPKPLKKKHDLPEIPQSMLVKQASEPLYSQRLQHLDSYSNYSERPLLLQKKQPNAATEKLMNTSKVTLDNPAILEQQMEALTHHKMQLEKKGLLLSQKNQSPISCIPKLSSTSLIKNEHNDVIYSNLSNTNDGASIVDNMKSTMNHYRPSNSKANLSDANYCNVSYDKNVPLLQNMLLASNSDCANPNDDNEDIPPPPSPVSSSYSELRRATNTSQIKQTDLGKQQNSMKKHYAMYADSTGEGLNAKNNVLPHTYMNMNYNNEYSGYSPTLRSIAQDSSDFYGYGSFSQGSSTYESIYEPINPRPPSQLSSRSNYLICAPYVNASLQMTDKIGSGMLSNSSSKNLSHIGNIPSNGAHPHLFPNSGNDAMLPTLNTQKRDEVETLTDFLVHSMDSVNDVDSYGVCFKCNERVLGENSGCTAMDQIYHISCFTCSQCQINLQGKPFYALDRRPFCEYDYLQTLEKCSICTKPILERILRASGKPYHPQCFICIICGKSLDGIPFTVDAINQNYCIADFHKKFAPRCCVCEKPIMPEPGEEETVRVVALDRSFHFECYKCEDCGVLLSSEAEGRGCYPLDDHVLCKSCNAKRVQMLSNRMTTEL